MYYYYCRLIDDSGPGEGKKGFRRIGLNRKPADSGAALAEVQTIQAELDAVAIKNPQTACDQGAVQGKRIRVLQVATLPKPES
jgi:hypothetical protein